MSSVENALKQALEKRPAGIDRWDKLWDAAVLMPLVYVRDVPSILFEVRSKMLRRQPGEICFPGGKHECRDKSFSITAVRETCEELGLVDSDIEILGELDALVTHSGPIIHPFLGKLSGTECISVNKAEVEDVFTVPLRFLLDCSPRVGHVQLADRPREDFPFDLVPGRQRDWRDNRDYAVYFYEYGDRVIWGLTARMLRAFLESNRQLLEGIVR